MIHIRQNYAFIDPPLDDNDVVKDCNCSQKFPGTPIGSGKSGLSFFDSNLVNCAVPGDAVVSECNEAQIDFCYWLHDNLGLPVEVDNCRHVVDIDNVTVDGHTQTFYDREDTVL